MYIYTHVHTLSTHSAALAALAPGQPVVEERLEVALGIVDAGLRGAVLRMADPVLGAAVHAIVPVAREAPARATVRAPHAAHPRYLTLQPVLPPLHQWRVHAFLRFHKTKDSTLVDSDCCRVFRFEFSPCLRPFETYVSSVYSD